MLALSLRDSSLFRRVVSACWCALLLGCKIMPITRGYLLPFWRYRRDVLLGDAGVVAEFLDLFEGAIASGRKILSIPRAYLLPLGLYHRGVLLGDAGVVAEFLDLFEGAIASIGVVAWLCCKNYSRR